MPTLTYSFLVTLERSPNRTTTIGGKTPVTGTFLTGEDETGYQNQLRSRVSLDRSNARSVRSK